MKKFYDFDDKDLAMICIAAIGIVALFMIKDLNILHYCILAIASLATGKPFSGK